MEVVIKKTSNKEIVRSGNLIRKTFPLYIASRNNLTGIILGSILREFRLAPGFPLLEKIEYLKPNLSIWVEDVKGYPLNRYLQTVALKDRGWLSIYVQLLHTVISLNVAGFVTNDAYTNNFHIVPIEAARRRNVKLCIGKATFVMEPSTQIFLIDTDMGERTYQNSMFYKSFTNTHSGHCTVQVDTLYRDLYSIVNDLYVPISNCPIQIQELLRLWQMRLNVGIQSHQPITMIGEDLLNLASAYSAMIDGEPVLTDERMLEYDIETIESVQSTLWEMYQKMVDSVDLPSNI